MADQAPASEDRYASWRTNLESPRLTLQNFIWNQHFGWHVHPSIDLSSIEKPQIAEVATGTALWLLQLSQQLPTSAALVGTDISLGSCPPSDILPSNVSLEKWNVFDPVPERHRNRFDYVHTRLLYPGFRTPGQVDQAMENIKQLLKPGGYLQWEELNYKEPMGELTFSHTPESVKAAAKRFTHLHSVALQKDNPAMAWARTLRDGMTATGYQEIKVVDKPTDPIYAKAFHQGSVMFMAQISGVLAKYMDPAVAKEWMETWSSLVEAGEKGEYYTSFLTPICVVGRKPKD